MSYESIFFCIIYIYIIKFYQLTKNKFKIVVERTDRGTILSAGHHIIV